MFCANCGMKIQDGELKCKYCGELQPLEEKNALKEINTINQKKRKRKKQIGIVLLFALVLSIASLFGYLTSSSGRLMRARFCMNLHNPFRAYDIVYKEMGEEAADYRKYADCMMKISDMCGLNTKEKIASAITELEQALTKAKQSKYLLSEEQKRLSLITERIQLYRDSVSDINEFEQNLNTACNVYQVFESLDKGESFNAEALKGKFLKEKEALEAANKYHMERIGSMMDGYSEISKALEAAIFKMDEAMLEFESSSTIYYKTFTLDEKHLYPYDETDIEKMKEGLHQELAKDCFRDLL